MAYSYSVGDQAQVSQRSIAFVLVVSIHVLFFWVLSSGLGATIIRFVAPPSQAKFIDAARDPLPQPLPTPNISHPLPVVPMPDLDIPRADASSDNTITVASRDQPAAQVSPPAQTLNPISSRTPPSATGRGAHTPLPEYPASARRLGEAGTVTLKCYVSEAGRCREVSVVTSSGFGDLDNAAVREVQRNWRFVPAKENGRPVAAWHSFAITFRLTD